MLGKTLGRYGNSYVEAAPIRGVTPPTRTPTVENWNTDVREEARMVYRRFTNGFEEERVVVKIILDEPDIPLTLFSSTLHHDIQSSL